MSSIRSDTALLNWMERGKVRTNLRRELWNWHLSWHGASAVVRAYAREDTCRKALHNAAWEAGMTVPMTPNDPTDTALLDAFERNRFQVLRLGEDRGWRVYYGANTFVDESTLRDAIGGAIAALTVQKMQEVPFRKT